MKIILSSAWDKLVVLLLLLIVSVSHAITPEEINRLTVRSPFPSAGTYREMVVQGNTIVAATDQGEIIVSTDDGESWLKTADLTFEENGLARPLYIDGLTFGEGTWVVVDKNSSHIARSSDLINWQIDLVSAAGTYSDLAFGNGLFVATAYGGRIDWSDDGISWTTSTLPNNVSRLESMTFQNGIFVAAGRQALLSSTDGKNWTAYDLSIELPEWLERVSFANGTFFATGRRGLIFTSPDGENWTRRDLGTSTTLGRVFEEPSGQTSILVGPRLYQLNNDFSSFNEAVLPASFGTIATTSAGSLIGAGRNAILQRRAPGAMTWTDKRETLAENFSSVAFGKGLFVIVDTGENQIFTSPTGDTWDLRFRGRARFETNVVFNGKKFAMLNSLGELVSSTDGITWSVTPTNITFNPDQFRFRNNRWLAVGPSGNIAESADAITWTQGNLGEDIHLSSVTYGDGLYVIVSSDTPSIYTSPDFQTWTPRTVASSTASHYVNIEFGNGRFLAFPGIGVPAFSENGIDWTQLTDQREIFGGQTTGYDEELGFYVLGNIGRVIYWPKDSTLEDGFIYGTSFPATQPLDGLAAGNGTLVGVGRLGLVMRVPITSADYESWAMQEFGMGASNTINGAGRDPDGDGVKNLEEYVRGTDPQSPTPALVITQSNSGFGPEARFTQRSGLDDIVGFIEYSTDLINWSRAGVQRTVTDLGDGEESITGRVTGNLGDGLKLFMRAQWEFTGD